MVAAILTLHVLRRAGRLLSPAAALLLVALQVPAPEIPIRFIPREVDTTFAHRAVICPGATGQGGAFRPNDERRPVVELFGAIVSVDVHQYGTGFPDSTAVRRYLTRLLAERPRVSYASVPWAEGTPLEEWGVLGTVRYAGGADARVEAVGPYLCLQRGDGLGTWWRLAPIDLWNPR